MCQLERERVQGFEPLSCVAKDPERELEQEARADNVPNIHIWCQCCLPDCSHWVPGGRRQAFPSMPEMTLSKSCFRRE